MSEETPNDAPGEAPAHDRILASSKGQVRVRTDRFRTAYANNIAVSFSTFDVSFLLGEIVAEKDGQPVIEEFLKINMSRELSKALAILLVQHLNVWEQKFGEIKIPDLDSAAFLAEMGVAVPGESKPE